jgi:hypothetical protein
MTMTLPRKLPSKKLCTQLCTLLFTLLLCRVSFSAQAGSFDVVSKASFQNLMSKIEQERDAWSETNLRPHPIERRVALALTLLGTPYAANTMIGSTMQKETLVLRADSLDCMTFLDLLLVAETVDRGADPRDAMIRQRYFNAQPAYENRHHFFSDWIVSGPRLFDVGSSFPEAELQQITLNARDTNRRWLDGVPTREVFIHWVPGNSQALPYFQTGDLVGFNSALDGLDVSHLGMVLVENNQVDLVHASSATGHVVREALATMRGWKKGVIVLRSR